ncbi:MAG: hypothetical protein AAF587_26280 [Bacteroidota bacterium]
MNLFRRRKKKNPPDPTLTFPQTIELIPGELSVEVFLHEVQIMGTNKQIPTVAYLSKGLAAIGQKEVFFVLKNEEQRYEELPPEPIHFVNTIYAYAQKGQIVDRGDITQFGARDVLGWKGVIYVSPPAHLSHLFPDPCLSVILLSASEVQVIQEVGAMRILSMLGKQFAYYPFPYWSDLQRKELPIQQMMQQSVLGHMKCLSIGSAHLSLSRNRIRWTAPKGNVPAFLTMDKLSTNEAVALFPSLDPQANACLTYSFDAPENGPQAISPPGGDGSVLSGCSLMLVAGQDHYSSKIVEDGFCLMLTDGEWEDFWQAFLNERAVSFHTDQTYSFEMTWREAGETVQYQPKGEMAEKAPIHVDHIHLLTDEETVEKNLDLNNLSDLIYTLEHAIITSLEAYPEVSGRLRLSITLHPDKEVELDLASEGFEQADDCLQAVYDALLQIEAFPSKTDPIPFQVIVNVRNQS